MVSAFHGLPTAALRALVEALRVGRLKAPVTDTALARIGLAHLSADSAAELQSLLAEPFSPAAVAWGLDRLVAERELQLSAHRTELVWTGPEGPGAGSRDTSVVVRELMSSAERSVLVATYAIFQGAKVFKALADRMAVVPELSVRMFVNISRPPGNQATEAELLRAFEERFIAEDWPRGTRLPDLFYDPRALSSGPGPRAAMHAKCIVVDDSRAFVTSANFTQAAQERNMEAGVLVNDPAFARALRDQFESLVETRQVLQVPRLQR